MIDVQAARVAEMWRFPVKSMRGERITEAEAGETGFTGDRAYAVVDPATGKVGSAKHPRLWGALLQCEARYVAPPRAGAPLPEVVDHAARRLRDRIRRSRGRRTPLGRVRPPGAADDGRAGGERLPRGVARVRRRDARRRARPDHRRGQRGRGHAHRPVARGRVGAGHVLRRRRAARAHDRHARSPGRARTRRAGSRWSGTGRTW